MRNVSVSGSVRGCVAAKHIITINMLHRTNTWLLVVGGQVQGSRLCVRNEGFCATGSVTDFDPVVKPFGTTLKKASKIISNHFSIYSIQGHGGYFGSVVRRFGNTLKKA